MCERLEVYSRSSFKAHRQLAEMKRREQNVFASENRVLPE